MGEKKKSTSTFYFQKSKNVTQVFLLLNISKLMYQVEIVRSLPDNIKRLEAPVVVICHCDMNSVE